MKKILLGLSLMIAANTQAQLNQNFSSVGTISSVTVGTGSWMVGGLPSGWTQYNGDGFTPYTSLAAAFGTNAWITREITYSSGTKDTVAVSTSWYTPAGVANDWLISPSFTPTTGQWLLFDALASNGSYPDGFQVKISTSGGNYTNFTSAAVLTVAAESATSWVTHAVNLSTYVGQAINIAIINNSNDMELLYLNNIRTTVLPSADLALMSMTPKKASAQAYALVNGAISITGAIKNFGSSTVTNYTVKLNDGTTTQSFPQTGNILPYASGTYNISYTMPSVGLKPIKMWVEFTGDVNQTNDTLKNEFIGATFAPTHLNVMEEATGTWCGWCPRGAVYMDSVHKQYPNDIYVAVHNSTSDPMTVTTYDNGLKGFVSGYPSVVMNRIATDDPSKLFTLYTANKTNFGVADITVAQPTVNGTTLTVKADAKFAISAPSGYDYRLALVITEDKVHGTTAGYNQTNYYSSTSQNLALSGAGHNWQTEANPVPAANMYYDFVARDIVNSFNGVSGSIPASTTAGSTYSYTFTWTIPSTVNLNNCKANVILISALSGEAQNGAWKTIYPTSVNSINAIENVTIFPNPASTTATLNFNVVETKNITIELYDQLGRMILPVANQEFTAGSNQVQINTANLAAGIYNVKLQTENGVTTQRLTIAK